MQRSKFKGGSPTTALPVGELIAAGYHRVSNAYGLVARIDREDWLHVLAQSMPGRCVADFCVIAGPDAGKPSERWANHYRRVYSKDIHTVSEEDISKFPAS